jgi:hypothetical protein
LIGADFVTPDMKTFYQPKSGTSMAAPTAAGIGVLLNQIAKRQMGRPLRADEMKAVLIHTAINKPTEVRKNHSIKKIDGPNYKTGWGAIRADYAGYVLDPASAKMKAQRQGLSNWISAYEAEFPGGFLWSDSDTVTPFRRTLGHIQGKDVRVTVVWLDPPGESAPNKSLRYDLDLIVTGPNNEHYRVWCVNVRTAAPYKCERNNVDNVERVDVEAAKARGNWTIEVKEKNGMPVPFALVVSGLQRAPLPPEPPIAGPTGESSKPRYCEVTGSKVFIRSSPRRPPRRLLGINAIGYFRRDDNIYVTYIHGNNGWVRVRNYCPWKIGRWTPLVRPGYISLRYLRCSDTPPECGPF